MKKEYKYKLAVVIVNYNVEYFLEQCLNSVKAALKHVSGEVFIVDNNSIDGSVEMVKNRFPEYQLIDNKINLGFSKANNQAMLLANSEYVLLLNPDTVVEEDTFEKVIDFMDKHPEAGGLGVRMLDGKGNFLPESKRGLPTPLVAFYKIFGISSLFPKSKIFGKYHLGYLSEHETNEIEILSGAFMLMRQEALDKVGLLDEAFFMYGEDIDLSYRIIKGGFKNYYFPETRIIHYKGESTFKDKIYFERFYEAMKIFYKKHFKTNFLIDFLTNVAIKCFLIFNSFWKKSNVKQIPESYIFISEDDDFRLVLEQKLLKNVSLLKNHKAHNFNLLKKDSIEIIFDNNFVTNKEIIAFIQKNKNRNFTFKIRPRTTNFLIGSNSKDEKGEVII